MKDLLNVFPKPGKVEWIGIRPAKFAPLVQRESVEIDVELGLIGDHYQGKSKKRQVTFIQKEHLQAVAQMLEKEAIPPAWTRRNIVVSGINLLALKNCQFQIGSAIFEMTGLCHPCSRMEQALGKGGYNAMRGHGGITAKVIQGGVIQLNDEVSFRELLETAK